MSPLSPDTLTPRPERPRPERARPETARPTDDGGSPEAAPVLALHDVRVTDRAGDREIVHGVTFTLTPGKAVGIVGESGSGKTLTCRAVLGILPPHFEVSGGRVDLMGEDTATKTPRQWTDLRGSTIGAVFQDPASYLNPAITVGAQIAEVLRVKRGLSRRAARRRAVELLAAVRLRDPGRVHGQYVHELSGGMLQRVLIAAAVAVEPRALIADEATTALDVTVQAEILDLLADLRERTGLALVVVSHDLAVVAHLCDEVLVMRRGEVVEQGETRSVLHHPRHPYTRLLVAEHEQYGLDRFRHPSGGVMTTPAVKAAREAEPGAVLEVTGLDVHHGRGRARRRVLRDVTLGIAPGEIVGLIGETGSGKSTLARAVLGLVPPSAGSIRVAGEDVGAYGPRQWRALRRRGVIQYVFQDPLRSLDPDLTIEDSLVEPLLIQGVRRKEAAPRVRSFLDRVRLTPDLLERLPAELSGGQRQRVAVARALVTGPRLVVLDEPVSALDSANRVQVLEILKELRASGVALLLISHDLGSVAGTADRVAVLHRGELVETGAARDIVNHPVHPYTRLLLGSAPTLRGRPAGRAEREALRALPAD
ncbi:ATP-binding cassette domain-containing protein [Streptomyces tagetis]|uniref:ABC transporter ATP-binding protein n=1 Tax=Streptomyces tagetis TaxID=2820809 RepID=A0A940XAC0_9ACTN|nr:ABC transporter ATP-binding protein [Streptomyces sp. RG38]MBQ0826473.1 ABC transporter ATP-binding protein [Streptomyces sp. RG38]